MLGLDEEEVLAASRHQLEPVILMALVHDLDLSESSKLDAKRRTLDSVLAVAELDKLVAGENEEGLLHSEAMRATRRMEGDK